MGKPQTRQLAPFQRLANLLRRFLLAPLDLTSKVCLTFAPSPATVRIAGESRRLDELVNQCGSIAGENAWYGSPIWMKSGHIQTIFCTLADFSSMDRIVYERTFLRVPDGGTLALDSTVHDPALPDDAPILVCLHGLTGGSHESYVRSVLSHIIPPRSKGGLGYRGIVVNSRGCAGSELTSPQLYHGGYSDDLRRALLYIRATYPRAPLAGIGFSLGANILSKYLGEEGDKTPLSAAVVLGNPWDFYKGHQYLESSTMGDIYSRAMAKNLRRVCHTHREALEKAMDFTALDANPRQRLYEFDSVGTRVLGGYPSTEAYYRDVSSFKYLSGVRVPLLGMNALNDPIANGNCIPTDLLSKATDEGHSYVVIATTKGGGHLGWFEAGFLGTGLGFGKRRWVRRPVAEWLEALVTKAEPRHVGKEGRKPRIGDEMALDPEREDIGFKMVEGKKKVIGGNDPGEGGLLSRGL